MSSDDREKIEQRIDISGQAGNVTQIGKIVVQVNQFFDEKIFKKIGLEQRVGFTLLGILVVGSVLTLYWALSPKLPTRMAGDFRIAVAGFAEEGNFKDSEVGVEVAEGVYLRLQKIVDKANLDFTVTVWGPHQIGIIENRSAAERAIAAAQIAKKIGADVIIYGVVEGADTKQQITPEFYVPDENFYMAEEITGQHELGTPLSISGQNNSANRIEISSELSARSQALTYIVIGLAYYSVRNFEKALSNFHAAEKIQGWEDNEGKEVLFLLIGNAAVKSEDLKQGETYYKKSLALDPEYARGYLGLANVYYRLSLKPFEGTLDSTDTDAGLLTQAIEAYKHATKVTNQPPLSDITTKAHFGLGQAYFLRVYSRKEEHFDSAIAEFEAVVEDYGNGTNPHVRELAAESHARLALIYDLSGHTDWAIEKYQLAVSLLYDNPDRQSEYEQRIQELRDHVKESHNP